MLSHRPFHALIEPLEARIAPALIVLNPLADLTVGPGKAGADIDLSRLFDPLISDNGHTIVTLQTNFDSDPATPRIQASLPIVIELLDDEAPLTVQNFISYLTNSDPKSNYKDTFFHRSVAGFVVQGGGFNANTPGTHIPTPFDVHNEFDGVKRSNLLGTLAVAKSIGPNTGNSEWFFNLADNSSNLDNQNGSFTVFARVVQGMDVVNAIAALSTFNFSGNTANGVVPIGSLSSVLTNLPLQNYVSDPDHNPNTPAPTPSLDNIIKLTGITVTPPPSGSASGITYSINPTVDVVDATTGLASDLVAATITGSKLHLTYKVHAAGAVRVTVHGTDAQSSSGGDTFLVNLQPNLVASFAQDPFDGIIIGGDTKASNIVIGNNGGGWAVGNVDVKVYLSKVDGSSGIDPNGAIIEPDRDLLIGTFSGQHIDVAGGGTVTLNKSLQIPRQLVTTAGEVYRMLVEVTPSDSVIAERFADDNVSLDSSQHIWVNGFGTFSVNGFGSRTDSRLVYQEADGDVVQLSISKGGNGGITYDGSLVDLSVFGARPRGALSARIISPVGQGERDIDLHHVELFQNIGLVSMPQATLTGSLSAAGGFRQLILGDLEGPGLISIGKLPAGTTINPTLSFHNVSDFSLESLPRIRTIRAAQWVETDGIPNHIEAAAIGGITIHGNLETSIALIRPTSLGFLNVGGFLKNADLVTRGDVGRVSVGGLDHANIFVGVAERPVSAGDFAQTHSLGTLSVHGVAGFSHAFIASNAAAAHIGAIAIVGVEKISSPDRFGIVADEIGSYVRRNGPSSGPLSQPQVFDRRGTYSLTIV